MQEVSLGDDVTLLALPFADLEDLDPSLTFKWRKRSPKIYGTGNELEFKASSNSHFKGFVSCEISKNQKHFFTVYHCLRNRGGKGNIRAVASFFNTYRFSLGFLRFHKYIRLLGLT